jgi:hypothetical protein
MKRVVLEIDFFKDEILILKCPFCQNIVCDSSKPNEESEFDINLCAHTLFSAVNEYLEYRSPLLNRYLEKFSDEKIESMNIYYKWGLLARLKIEEGVIYEICDGSISPFNNGDVLYYGFALNAQ